MLSAIACALAQAQQWDKVAQTVERIAHEGIRATTHSLLAPIAAQAAVKRRLPDISFSIALQHARAIPSAQLHVSTMCRIAQIAADAGCSEVAQDVCEQILEVVRVLGNAEERDLYWEQISGILADIHSWNLAAATVHKISAAERRTQAQAALARAAINVQHWQFAYTLAEVNPDDTLLSSVMRALVNARLRTEADIHEVTALLGKLWS